jgi:hypothetical protein
MESGRPRYLMGKVTRVVGRSAKISSRSRLPQEIGAIDDFWMFVCNPVTCPKRFMRWLNAHTSRFSGRRKITTSSAYMETRHLARSLAILVRIPAFVAKLRKHCKGSIARMNSRGIAGPLAATLYHGVSTAPECH